MARSFSELVARVGRDQRGAPKVQVVLSVYCLTRDTGVPVPTSEVTEFLKLHLRRTGLPANVAMVLARARPYVEIVSANGSRVWRVTQSGTEWLEGLTGERLAANLDGEVSLR